MRRISVRLLSQHQKNGQLVSEIGRELKVYMPLFNERDFMKITYLGTGAAEGIPALFCQCEYCKGVRARGGKEIRSRAQVLIDEELSIDFPPDAFYHGAVFGADLSAVKYLLVTHSHMDHFYAHDFILRGYKYASNMRSPSLDIYGNAEIGEVFFECTKRELRESVAQTIRTHTLKAFEEVLIGDYRVYPLKAQHSSRDPLVYLIEKDGKRILHLTDTGILPEEDFEYFTRLGGKPFDLITFDCTFLWNRADEGARHMGLYENARLVQRFEEMGLASSQTKKVITHFSHNSQPTKKSLKRAEKEFGFLAAYDGMTLELK